jgi:hypothetical protein
MITVTALGCASAPPRYRDVASLRSVVMGESKADVLGTFSAREVGETKQTIKVEPMWIRATRQNGAEVLEIGEVPLVDPASGRVRYYWFLFKNEHLAMWGRPEDWRPVSQQFSIDFEPRAAPAPSK